jgi:5S rRNA maturation endonuclease (ribonuclease M5)
MNNYDKEYILLNKKITAYLGAELKKLYRSPLPGRTDSTPSFSVFIGRKGNQMFKDLGGAGLAGDIISLHRILNNCDFNVACTELALWNGCTVQCAVSSSPVKHSNKISCTTPSIGKIGVRTDIPVEQSKYLQETGLPIQAWLVDQLGIYVDEIGNLCIQTNKNFHVKGGKLSSGRRYSGNLGEAGYSICGNLGSEKWIVVEGLGDLLALVDTTNKFDGYGFLILNSTSCIYQSIKHLQKQNPAEILLLLDNDTAGNEGTKLLQAVLVNTRDIRCEFITTEKDILDTWTYRKNIS